LLIKLYVVKFVSASVAFQTIQYYILCSHYLDIILVGFDLINTLTYIGNILLVVIVGLDTCTENDIRVFLFSKCSVCSYYIQPLCYLLDISCYLIVPRLLSHNHANF